MNGLNRAKLLAECFWRNDKSLGVGSGHIFEQHLSVQIQLPCVIFLLHGHKLIHPIHESTSSSIKPVVKFSKDYLLNTSALFCSHTSTPGCPVCLRSVTIRITAFISGHSYVLLSGLFVGKVIVILLIKDLLFLVVSWLVMLGWH